MIHTSTEKKQYQWVGRKYISDQDGLVEEPIRRGKTLPMITDEELQKMIPITDQEEAELVELGEKIERGEPLTEAEKERAKVLLKKPKRDNRFSSEPSISTDAIKVFFKE